MLAEVARSVLAVGKLHMYLEHLFALPLPPAVRPALRTISVLHLRDTRHDAEDWRAKRDRYVTKRLTQANSGQIAYYRREADWAGRSLGWATACFYAFWGLAFCATATKVALHGHLEAHAGGIGDAWIAVLGMFAIVMPVSAAGALSFVAALDIDARRHTYRETLEFLARQEGLLRAATSERDVARLVLETETHLLGETATWSSRRAFTAVA